MIRHDQSFPQSQTATASAYTTPRHRSVAGSGSDFSSAGQSLAWGSSSRGSVSSDPTITGSGISRSAWGSSRNGNAVRGAEQTGNNATYVNASASASASVGAGASRRIASANGGSTTVVNASDDNNDNVNIATAMDDVAKIWEKTINSSNFSLFLDCARRVSKLQKKSRAC